MHNYLMVIIMKKIFKAYLSSIIMIISMIMGIILGIILKENTSYLEPLGTLFTNLLCSIIVPFLFTSLALSFAKLNSNIALKIIKKIIGVFLLYSLVAVMWGIFVTKSFNLVTDNIALTTTNMADETTNIFKQFVGMLSVNDFVKLLSKDNLIAIMVIASLIGIAINKNKDDNLIKILESIDKLLITLLRYIMYYAPIGICTYMACTVGQLGLSIIASYLKVFVIYLFSSIVFAGAFYSFIAKMTNTSIKKFWRTSLPVIATSLSTCSSAATMPINILCANKLNNNEYINKTTISLGTSFHKDGSVIDSVFKVMFLISLFNMKVSLFKIIIVVLLATLLITAVPIGGGTMSEMLIITLLGFPVNALPILTIIATITDAPATMLNALGDTSAVLLVNKSVKKRRYIIAS